MKEETRQLPHSLTLENRTLLKAGGVLRIDSFDEETIAAATGGGRLLIRGENLHIEALDVDAGTLTVTGKVTSLAYVDSGKRGGLSRLFR